jgi:starch synthase
MPSPEIAPLAKSGGLGDVAGSLPPALARLGVQVRLVMPFYAQTRAQARRAADTGVALKVAVGREVLEAEVWETELEGVPVSLLRYDPYFDRPHLYFDHRGEYPDNAQRFVFFAKAAIELARRLEFDADVVHCHDWQTSLVPVYLKTGVVEAGPLHKAATVLTVHNLAYQGVFGRELFPLTGLPPHLNTMEGLEFWGNLSFLKAGLLFSDAITTVSPTYADEIQAPELGMGLEGVLARRSGDVVGILNGADYGVWSPENDPHLPAAFSAEDPAGKQESRAQLCREYGLEPPGPDTAVVGFVGRLAHQKGVDLILRAAPRLLLDDVRLCLLGQGEPGLEGRLAELAEARPGRVGVRIAFDERLAHLLQAGSDLLLMPSRYEPCGLNQIYALRYGTVPVVRGTGGLKDTVEPFDPLTGQGTGFVFDRPLPEELLHALREALWTKSRPELWRRVVANGMARDFSWAQSARRYADLYARLAGAA